MTFADTVKIAGNTTVGGTLGATGANFNRFDTNTLDTTGNVTLGNDVCRYCRNC